MYFLRFTSDPERDIEHGHSLWFFGPGVDDEKAQRMQSDGKAMHYDEDVQMWAQLHAGLSGHALQSSSLDDAIAEVREGSWYGNADKQTWAIFEGSHATPNQKYCETPEGCDFTPKRVVHFCDEHEGRNASL